MIDEKIKKAWLLSQLPVSKGTYPGVLADAYIQAEARARMAEYLACFHGEKMKWTLADWVAQVEGELNATARDK